MTYIVTLMSFQTLSFINYAYGFELQGAWVQIKRTRLFNWNFEIGYKPALKR